jgi:flagellar motor protein MotB
MTNAEANAASPVSSLQFRHSSLIRPSGFDIRHLLRLNGVSLFWSKRLKTRTDDSSWAVPFGDLMTLLLAVFVMIAGMSELRPGRRYSKVEASIKGAFGAQPAPARQAPATLHRLSLLERLEQGLPNATSVRLCDAAEEPLPPCEVIGDEDTIIIRVAAENAFLGPTGVAAPRTRKLLAVIADYLREGQARLEVRGYGPDGTLPPGLPYLDALDVAAERARTASRELSRSGVAASRLACVARAEPAGGRGFEIVVHASPADNAGTVTATKGGRKNG